MDSSQRLQLNNMIKENNVEDNTDLIRTLKHSNILRKDTQTLIDLKIKNYNKSADELNELFSANCQFLFNFYTDIYNRLRKDELDVSLWFKTLDLLEKIENGEVDQHEGSFLFGNLMKDVYIDSALRKANKLKVKEDFSEQQQSKHNHEEKKIRWKEFKELKQLTIAKLKNAEDEAKAKTNAKNLGATKPQL